MKKLSKGKKIGLIIILAVLIFAISGIVLFTFLRRDKDVSYVISETEYRILNDKAGNLYIQCYAAIKNTGKSNLYLGSGKFVIKDEKGKLIDTFYANTYPQIIAPNEIATCHELISFPDGGKLSEKNKKYNVSLKIDVQEAEVPLLQYGIRDLCVSGPDEGILTIKGNVLNNSAETFDECMVFVILYDKNGKFLGIDSQYIMKVFPPGQKESFAFLVNIGGFGVTDDIVGNFYVYAYPYQYQLD